MSAEQAPTVRRWLIFISISIPLLLIGTDATIVASAISVIEADTSEGLEWVSWTITAYALGQMVMLPIAGRLGEIIGRKRLLIIALLVFAAASLLCSVSTSIPQLVLFRVIQALGGGAFIPSATGIVAEHFGPSRDRAIGLFSSIYPVGAVVGPIIGGVIVSTTDWHAIFLVSPPLSLVAAWVAAVVIPRSQQRVPGSIDILGMSFFIVAVLAFMVAVSLLGNADADIFDAPVIAFATVGALAAVSLGLRIRFAANPFIPPSLLVGRGFGTMNVFNVLYGAAAVGFISLVPLYASQRFDIDVFGAGTLMTARSIGTIAVGAVAAFMLRSTGYRAPIALGSICVALGLLGHALVPGSVAPYPWLFAAGTLAGVGVGLAVPAANNAALQLAPDRVGPIAGLRAMFRQGGAIASVSIATSIAARSDDAGGALAIVFVAWAAIMLLLLALLPLVPQSRGGW